MDRRRRVEMFSTPTPIGGPPRGRFGLSGLSRHPVRILMVVGGLILLVVIFFIAILTVDGGGSDDKKPKTVGPSTSASASASKNGTAATGKSTSGKPASGPAQTAVAPKPDSIPATVHSGNKLVMYKGTSYQADRILQITTGTEVRANCRSQGSIAYFAGSSSKTWAQIEVDGKTGFVPAIFLDTGGDIDKQLPACAS
ncbi:hypothetical protein [Streptomyces sp. SID3343]|uniref:hypothetical protein n=1 Tax=Streptomyces sp. SID3343 TaxID=2690260 RepID=UPI0013695480|nr:hypothetical protein [Streptomyces sp. SID3343]MYW04341.1 hypothetical protein [Streptomyces sp. SID3343]